MFHPPGRARCCRKRESKAAVGQERCSAFPRVDTIWLFFTKGILMRGQSSWSAAAAAAAPCSLSGGSTRDAEPAWVLPYPLRVKQKKPLPCRGLWSPLTKSNGVCHLNRLPVLLGSSNPGVRRCGSRKSMEIRYSSPECTILHSSSSALSATVERWCTGRSCCARGRLRQRWQKSIYQVSMRFSDTPPCWSRC